MPSFKSIKFSLVLLFSLSLAACGGGGSKSGGGGGDTSTKPTVTAFTKSIAETTAAGTSLGTLVATDGGKAITAYAITGADAASFTISNSGELKVKTGVTFDSAAKSSYAFKATATNEEGTSPEADVTVTVTAVQITFTSSNPPKIMFIGDSITAGQGGLTTAEADAAVATAQAAFNNAETDLGAKAAEFTSAENAHSIAKGNAITNAAGLTAVLIELNKTPPNYGAAKSAVDATTITAANKTSLKGAIDLAIGKQTAETNAATAKTEAETAKNTAQTNLNTAKNNQQSRIKLPSYRKNLKDLSEATDSIVKFDAVGINKPGPDGDFTDTEHEGYPGWSAQQLTDKNHAYVCNAENAGPGKSCNANQIGRILTGGPIKVCTAAEAAVANDDPFKFCYNEGDLYIGGKVDVATHVCTTAKKDAGTCAPYQLGHVYTDNAFGTNLSAIDHSLNTAANNPDIALIHIGTNDMAFKNIETDKAIEKAIAGIKELIATLRDKNPKVVILIAQIIPIAPSSEYYEAGVIGEYNTAIQAMKDADTNTLSPLVIVNQFEDFDGNEATLLTDGVHPNAAGDQKMAEKWMAKLQDFFVAE